MALLRLKTCDVQDLGYSLCSNGAFEAASSEAFCLSTAVETYPLPVG